MPGKSAGFQVLSIPHRWLRGSTSGWQLLEQTQALQDICPGTQGMAVGCLSTRAPYGWMSRSLAGRWVEEEPRVMSGFRAAIFIAVCSS